MLNLTWGDVDLKQKRLTVRESKAGEARHVPMNEVVIQTLQSLPRMLHNPYVFLVVATVENVSKTESRTRIGSGISRKPRSKTFIGTT